MDSKNINQVCTGRMCGNIKVAFDCEKYKQKQKETILKMLNSGMPELDILKYLGITKSDLEEIKKYK